MQKTITFLCMFLIWALLYCKQPGTYDNPPGYDFAQAKKYSLKNSLHEISGIILLNSNDHQIGAIQDEDGEFYYFHPDDKEYKQTRFAKRGDYEDVALLNNKDIVVLRSDGSLFTFPVALIANEEIGTTQEYKKIMPEGEYEGMYAENDKLYVL